VVSAPSSHERCRYGDLSSYLAILIARALLSAKIPPLLPPLGRLHISVFSCDNGRMKRAWTFLYRNDSYLRGVCDQHSSALEQRTRRPFYDKGYADERHAPALGAPPIDGDPVSWSHRFVCRGYSLHLTFPMICIWSSVFGWFGRFPSAAFQRKQILYPPGYGFPVPFGRWRSLLEPSCAH
jgi:hypothetical protein